MKDYYNILDVPPVASLDKIKEQYHLLLFAWHPDRYPDDQKAKAEAKTREIIEAYKILSISEMRKAYDTRRQVEHAEEQRYQWERAEEERQRQERRKQEEAETAQRRAREEQQRREHAEAQRRQREEAQQRQTQADAQRQQEAERANQRWQFIRTILILLVLLLSPLILWLLGFAKMR